MFLEFRVNEENLIFYLQTQFEDEDSNNKSSQGSRFILEPQISEERKTNSIN